MLTTSGTAVANLHPAVLEASHRGVPLVVLGGKEYGSGSSRDWAAKGTSLMGVKAVIAQTFERIHRSNLVGMGVLPLQFNEGQSASTLKLEGTETFDLIGLDQCMIILGICRNRVDR